MLDLVLHLLPPPQPLSATWGCSEKPDIGKPGRESSPDSNYAGPWSWPFQPPVLWENKPYCWGHPARGFCWGSPHHEPSVRGWPRADTHPNYIRQAPSLLKLGIRTGKIRWGLVTRKPGSPRVIIFRFVLVFREIKKWNWVHGLNKDEKKKQNTARVSDN